MKMKHSVELYNDGSELEPFYKNQSEVVFKQSSPTKDIVRTIGKASEILIKDVLDYEDFYSINETEARTK